MFGNQIRLSSANHHQGRRLYGLLNRPDIRPQSYPCSARRNCLFPARHPYKSFPNNRFERSRGASSVSQGGDR
jgi:hypothetical protein